MSLNPIPATVSELAGSRPIFPKQIGATLAQSLNLLSFREKRLLFARIESPGSIHVYSAECVAGERLRVQMLVPVLPLGGGLMPSVAIVAQSLPYSADVQKLPIKLPAGYSAVVAPTPNELEMPIRDFLTQADYYPGPVVDTRTLVGGRCYVVVWSPHNHMGKYALHMGYSWPMNWRYWLAIPYYWWKIRGWFGLSRAAAYWMIAGAIGLVLAVLVATKLRQQRIVKDS